MMMIFGSLDVSDVRLTSYAKQAPFWPRRVGRSRRTKWPKISANNFHSPWCPGFPIDTSSQPFLHVFSISRSYRDSISRRIEAAFTPVLTRPQGSLSAYRQLEHSTTFWLGPAVDRWQLSQTSTSRRLIDYATFSQPLHQCASEDKKAESPEANLTVTRNSAA